MRYACLGLLLLMAMPALAQNDKQVLAPTTQVRIQVVKGCQLNQAHQGPVALGSLNFGNVYNLNSPADAHTSLGAGSVQIRCTPGTSARITLGAGLYGSSVSDRKMRHVDGGATLSYQLYTSASRQTLWDDVLGVALVFNNDASQTLAIYGRIPVQLTPLPGAYQDQVVVTLSY